MEKDYSSRNTMNFMIAELLSSSDPVMYAIMKVIVNNTGYTYQCLPSPVFTNLDSIYDYFIDIFKRISVRAHVDSEHSREGTKLIINTHLSSKNLEKLEHLTELFNEYANELDACGNGFIIHKFIVKDDIIFVVFDLVITRDFEYESEYQLNHILVPYLENLDI